MMPCLTYVISFSYGNFPINGTKQLGTMMPCMTHDNSFYYAKFHANGTKKLGTMMVCITYVISCYFGSNTSSCIVLHNLQSYCFVLHHLASSCIILHPLASYCIILHRLASPCIVLHCLTSSCIVLHCLAASCIILHCLTFSYTILQHLALSCIITIWRSSSNLTADASSTHGIRHTATTKQQSSYNIAPCDKHATFVTILVCPTGPALEVPRHPAIERAALQPQTTSCPVHGQHSEPVPFCEAPLQKFLPGHPGAIHDPWSQHCYAAPATEVPRHRTTRMTRSHAPFAQTFPSANETATTKRPQTSRARDFKQTFCIQKFRDMHICSLAFKTMP